MAVALSLLPYMWKAWWRKLEQKGVWHGANTNMVMGFAFMGFMGVMVASIVALKSLRGDALAQGMMILEGNFSSVMMGWLVVPIMVGSTTAEGRGIQPTRMGQFPLSNLNFLLVGLMSRLVQPVYWILMGASLFALLPMLAVANPLPGFIAGILFIVFSAMLAWSVELFSSAIFTSRRGREIMMVVVLVAVVPFFAIINGDFSMADGNITFSLGDHSVLLFSDDGTSGLLTKTRDFSPAVWVSGVADGSRTTGGLSFLSLAAIFSSALTFFSLKRVMLHPPSSISGRKGTSKPIGVPFLFSYRSGPLFVKELRYLTRTLDHLMGVGMGLIAFAWILIRPEHLIFVLPLGAFNVVFNESAIPLNCFGLDGSGADRYRLLPLSGREVVLTKNLAYFAIVSLHLAPLFLAAFIKGAWLLGLCAMMGVASACLLTAIGGNIASINSPAPRAFFNFDSKEQTGGVLALIFAGVIWIIPIGVYFALAWVNIGAAAAGLAVLFGIVLLVYRISVGNAGKSFDEAGEKMRERLSKA